MKARLDLSLRKSSPASDVLDGNLDAKVSSVAAPAADVSFQRLLGRRMFLTRSCLGGESPFSVTLIGFRFSILLIRR